MIERLTKEQELIDKASGTSQGGGNTRLAQTQSGYKNYGDTADLWTLARSLVVIANMGKPALKFSAFKNQETARGDKYSLRFDIHNGMSMIDVFIAIEYSDGSLSFTSRRMPASGHVALDLQGDKRFDIRNMYGYVLFKPSEYEVLYVDNIMLLRTHLDEATYNVDNQKLLDRNKNRRIEAAKRKAEEDERRKQEQIERARHHADSIRMAFARKDSVEANSLRRPKPRSVPQRVR